MGDCAGGQLTRLFPCLAVRQVCPRYALPFAGCLLLRLHSAQRGRKQGLCLEDLAPVCPFSTDMSCPSWSVLEWTLTTFPLPPSAVLQLAALGPCVELRGAHCHPAGKQKPGPERRAVPSSLTSSIPCLGLGWVAARLQNRFTSPQWTEWFRL